jgi:hypothetical protein
MAQDANPKSTEQNLKMISFMQELMTLLQRYDLTQDSTNPEIPHDRAAGVLITEVHDWFRSGRIDAETESFSDYCEALQELNYEVDDIEDEYSAEDL